MNNNGWGLRAELGMCLVILLCFGVALFFIQDVVDKLNGDINIINDTSNNNLNFWSIFTKNKVQNSIEKVLTGI